MTSSSDNFNPTNSILQSNRELLRLASRADLDELLSKLDYDWIENRISKKSPLYEILDRHHYVADGGLNRQGKLFLSRILIQFDATAGDKAFGSLLDRYHDFKVLSSGKNSIVVLATHRLLDTHVILKIIRPGASDNIRSSVKKLAHTMPTKALVLPIDLIEISTNDLLGSKVTLDCLVFPVVTGQPFSNFLKQSNHHLNSQIAISFARQVGAALYELERVGAYHGDLHEGNILVDERLSHGIEFRLIDISYDSMGSMPLEVCRNTDIENFKQHIWRILSAQRASMPKISLRKYIGTRNFIKIEKILSVETRTFADVHAVLHNDIDFSSYSKERSAFVSQKFAPPTSFRLQRYEEITDPTIAVRLFVPYDPLMTRVREFSNIYVSGNRGSGKSTYLAALAFFPETSLPPVDFREAFGIYFPCRQGEFRPLASRPDQETSSERAWISRIVTIKIVRRALETLVNGVNAHKISEPASMRTLRAFIEQMIPPPGLVSVERDIQTELDNLVATMIRVEMDAIAAYTRGYAYAGWRHISLIEFFDIIRQTFSELSETRFHLLFDDAGSPYVPHSVQHVINDLIITSNPVFCVKLSAEKLTFDFRTSDGKILEAGQDYFEHDISHILFIGSGSTGLNRAVLERYFRQIVEQRLSYFGFASQNIVDYVGDEQITIDRLIALLSLSRKDAYYGGWTTIWNIADRTPRNLLEIVSEVFSVGNIERQTPAYVVSPRDQDRAIRTTSEKRLESLSQIPGSIQVGGNEVSLGRQLFEVTAAIGSTFRKYLRSDSRESHQRPRQHLAIERNDFGELSHDADVILRRLVTFGVLDSAKSAYARDDEVKKPFYVLNRIYCPAFGIGYRRDDHLRLSRGKLELLLSNPQRFLREGTTRLRTAAGGGEADLFGYKER